MITVGLDTSGIDPSFKSHAQRGIGRYVFELIKVLQQTSDPDIAVDFFDHTSVVEGGIGARAIDYMPCGRTTLKQQLLYPLRLSTGVTKRFSFLHFPAHMDAPAWSNKPFVLTVLDLIPLVLADLYKANRPGWRFRFARWLELKSIQQALVLLAISENTANDIVKILGVPRNRIVVTPLGVDASFFDIAELRRQGAPSGVRNKLGLHPSRPLVLYVGGHDERKNIRTLIDIMSRVRKVRHEEGHEVPQLVMAGRVTSPLEQARLDGALDHFEMRQDTAVLGYVPDAELKELYSESYLFLFPSLYEGFGLPVLEAMASGLPVVSSNSSSLPEVVGNAGSLFDPADADAGARAVLSLLSDSGRATKLSEEGWQRAKLFTWEETGRTTLEAYRLAGSLLEQGTPNKSRVSSLAGARGKHPLGSQSTHAL
jgi:glycosyltransferase involved in cell wall biosynthesis